MFPKYDIGKDGENYVKTILINAGLKCELNDNYELRYDYDLIAKLGRKKFTIEVKKDDMSAKTKNLAFEYYNSKSKKPSGIDVTKADIWVHLTPQNGEIQAYAIHVNKLRCYISTVTPFKHIKSGGDDNSDLWIYKMVDILPEFIRFDNINDGKELKAIFAEMLV